ncbi:hypothetical protein ZTR_09263 [Talaromyces verruculosus]|nr:hypothetical protein ZTR_09263 [Talaromyces verruculosus]
MPEQPTPDEVFSCLAALFEWAESFDTKVDYRQVMGKIWEEMPADEFIPLASSPQFLGDELLRTQHFIGGASSWNKVSDKEIQGHHQVRVAHQRYTDRSMKEVAIQGHAHGGATMWYKKVEGKWKFAGLSPNIRWGEFNYDEIFAPQCSH